MTTLDSAQELAVNSPYPLTLVVAGAGAGKTRVLIERIAFLIEQKNALPSEIIAMTFTRKAAQEMRERLLERIGRQAHQIHIGTLHAMALRYIKLFGDHLGLRGADVSVYGPWEESFLLKDTARMTRTKGKITVMDDFYPTGMIDFTHPQKRLFDVFMHRLRANNALTYGMLLISMEKLIPQIVRQQLRYIMVDEAQDLDALQWKIINGLKDQSPNIELFVVGDIDQSIYEWRGARPEMLLELEKSFHVYKLETNYRSGSAIVAAADQLIQNNVRRIPKRMKAHRTETGSLTIGSGVDSAAAAMMVQHIFEKGNSCTVLSRNHALLVKLSQGLMQRGVQHHYCGRNSKMIQGENFRRVHAIFQLIKNRFDNFSFDLARDFFEVSDFEYSQLLVDAVARDQSRLVAWMFSKQNDWTVFLSDALTLKFPELLARLMGIVKPTGYDFAMQLSLAHGFAAKGGTLEEYLEWIATYDIQEDVEVDLEGVQLMTIHACKGLEFPTVLLVGWNEGILPSSRSENPEEERRLAYVALTRARDNLIVTSRPESTEGKNGKIYSNPVSSFIQEIRVGEGG